MLTLNSHIAPDKASGGIDPLEMAELTQPLTEEAVEPLADWLDERLSELEMRLSHFWWTPVGLGR